MNSYWLEWGNAILRLLHVVTAIAWVGSSFYFVWLDNHLIKPKSPDLLEKGVDGALWAVHGGGFYNPQKYMVAPKKIHTELHWFYWESYSTWMTGFALFVAIYLFNPSVYLIDKTVMALTPAAAVGAALGFLAVFWLVYDTICRSLGQRAGGDRVVGGLVALFVVIATYLACHIFAGRAAFLMMGAMIATAMSANVFFWIIPGQRKVIAQMKAGQPVDPVHGRRAKQRSVHNTYFTVPVLIAMLSNHYGWLYNGPNNWLVLVLLMLAGALIRHFFVARHKVQVAQELGKEAAMPWHWMVAGALILGAVAMMRLPTPAAAAVGTAPAAGPATTAQTSTLSPGFAEVQAVIQQRCTLCHNDQIQQKNVALHTPALIRQHAQAINQQVSVTRLMPLNNATQMTDDERVLLRRWVESGAP